MENKIKQHVVEKAINICANRTSYLRTKHTVNTHKFIKLAMSNQNCFWVQNHVIILVRAAH